MIERLARALIDAGLSPEPDDLADLLWLATQRGARTHAGAHTAEQAAPVSAAESDTPCSDDEAQTRPPNHVLEEPVDQPVGLASHLVAGTFADGVLHVRGVAATGMPASLTKSLQAFSRRVRSRCEEVLDEEATAEWACETGFWMPVMRAEREYGFDLLLVTEECETSCLWTDAIDEFAHMLSTQVPFRHVHRLRLTGVDGKLADVHGTSGLLSRWRGSRTAHVLFVSDTLSSSWRCGAIASLLRTWCEVGPVTLLQPMPRRAWRHLPLGLPDLKLSSCGIVRHNRQLAIGASDDWFDIPADDTLPLPIVGLDGHSLQTWAEIMTGHAGVELAGVDLAHDRAQEEAAATAGGGVPRPAERVALFRQMVSPAAYQLAVQLAALDEMTLPVMRLVQRIMHPESGAGEMAEVFLGGLLEPVGVSGQQGSAERLYRFNAEVRCVLATSRRYSEERTIDFRLAGIDARMAQDNPMLPSRLGCFATPSGADRQTDWSLPFSAKSRRVLVNHVARSMAALSGTGEGTFDREAAIRGQREVLRAAALESEYALIDDEVIGDIPLTIKPDDSVWLVGLVRRVLVMTYASDDSVRILRAVPVEGLVFVDAKHEHGRAWLTFYKENRAVEYDTALWSDAFQLQLTVKDLGLKGQQAKAQRLQRTIREHEMLAEEFSPETTFFKIATPSSRAYGALDASYASTFAELEAGWLAPLSHAMMHTYRPTADVTELLRTFSLRIGSPRALYFAVPVQRRRTTTLVRIAEEHARAIGATVRALQILPARAAEIFSNTIRSAFPHAVGVCSNNPVLDGLLTYSFFDDGFELGGMDYGDPIYSQDAARPGGIAEEEAVPQADPHALTEWLTAAVDGGRVPNVEDSVFKELSYIVNGADWLFEVESYMVTDSELEHADLLEWTFDGEPFELMEVDQDSLIVARAIHATVRVYATISFFMRDGRDTTYVGFRDVDRSVELRLEAQFGFIGVTEKAPELAWIDIEHIAENVDFGIVEPHLEDPDDDDLDSALT